MRSGAPGSDRSPTTRPARPEAARGRPARGRDPRPAAAARAPARLHEGPPRRARASWGWARTGTGCRGSRSPRPTAAARVTYHGPGPAGRLSDRLAEALRRRRPRLRPPDGAGDDRLARRAHGIEAEVIEGLTGVWVGGPPARGPQDRLDRRPRQPRRHHPRLRDQRQQRPAAVRVDRPLRDRGLPDDLGLPRARRRAGHGRVHGHRSPSASARSTSASRSRSSSSGSTRAGRDAPAVR